MEDHSLVVNILFLVLGLLLLLVSGRYLVDSSVKIARRFRIPPMIIGLTIVAFGTSAPELLVSLQAALQGHPDMAVGNVIGSNISNILLVLALTTVIFPIAVQKESVRRDGPVMLIVTLLLAYFLSDNQLEQYEGGILVGLLLFYILSSILFSRNGKGMPKPEIDVATPVPPKIWIALLIFLGSCIGLALGADLLVDSASVLAAEIGISERVIAITMVALGTSLPELATSLIAAFKKEADISVGNIIGSNIMNIISVLGITALTQDKIEVVPEVMSVDVPWLLFATVLLILVMIVPVMGRRKISRVEGAFMLMVYISYIYFIFTK